MQYLSGIETFVLNNPLTELRIRSVNIKHNSQGNLFALEYQIEVFKENKEPITPRLFVLPNGLSTFHLLIRGQSVKRTLLIPDNDDVGGLTRSSLPSVIINDFLTRILHPAFKPKDMTVTITGFDDLTWQNQAVASGQLESLRFIARYMTCEYRYDTELEALAWKNGKVMYACVSDPVGKLTIDIDFDQYVQYVDMDKRSTLTFNAH